jgi:hypothetical protein
LFVSTDFRGGLFEARTKAVNPAEAASRPSLCALLEQLGTTADEVAATFKAQGILGVRNTARFLNPLNRYLQTQIRQSGLSLDVMQVQRVRLVFRDGQTEEAILPEPVLQFLQAFNAGAYPELQLPGSKQ